MKWSIISRRVANGFSLMNRMNSPTFGLLIFTFHLHELPLAETLIEKLVWRLLHDEIYRRPKPDPSLRLGLQYVI